MHLAWKQSRNLPGAVNFFHTIYIDWASNHNIKVWGWNGPPFGGFCGVFMVGLMTEFLTLLMRGAYCARTFFRWLFLLKIYVLKGQNFVTFPVYVWTPTLYTFGISKLPKKGLLEHFYPQRRQFSDLKIRFCRPKFFRIFFIVNGK